MLKRCKPNYLRVYSIVGFSRGNDCYVLPQWLIKVYDLCLEVSSLYPKSPQYIILNKESKKNLKIK